MNEIILGARAMGRITDYNLRVFGLYINFVQMTKYSLKSFQRLPKKYELYGLLNLIR